MLLLTSWCKLLTLSEWKNVSKKVQRKLSRFYACTSMSFYWTVQAKDDKHTRIITLHIHFLTCFIFYSSRQNIVNCNYLLCQSQWPRGLRRASTTARLQGLRIRIPPRARMSVSFECCVLSGRGLCDGLITRPEESYQSWCVLVWSRNLTEEA